MFPKAVINLCKQTDFQNVTYYRIARFYKEHINYLCWWKPGYEQTFVSLHPNSMSANRTKSAYKYFKGNKNRTHENSKQIRG